MGLAISNLFARLFGKKQIKIMMLGLDAAGKTAILYKLKLGKIVHTAPTIGFNVEIVECRDISFIVWDVSGHKVTRKVWWDSFPDARALIYVVDSNDRERIAEAAADLTDALEDRLMKEDELQKDALLLVFANKQDLTNAMSTAELTEELGLNSLCGLHWHVQSTSATQGHGLYEGLEWLSNELIKK